MRQENRNIFYISDLSLTIPDVRGHPPRRVFISQECLGQSGNTCNKIPGRWSGVFLTYEGNLSEAKKRLISGPNVCTQIHCININSTLNYFHLPNECL